MLHQPQFDVTTPDGLANAVRWLTGFVAMIAQGGVWIIPRSCAMYRIDHERKVAIYTSVSVVRDSSAETVFEAMGWKIERESE